MIFTFALADKILAGEKTVTRRPAKSKSGRLFKPPTVGDALTIQRGYAKPSATAVVTAVDRRYLWVITDGDARREGFADRTAFKAAWLAIYPHADWHHDEVWRIAFGLSKANS